VFSLAPGRRALITGGASGIGRAVAAAILKNGGAVAVADRDASALKRTVADLRGTAVGIQMDVRDVRSIDTGVAEANDALGGLDTLINSAGVCYLQPFEEIAEEDWDLVLDVNLKGTFLVTQRATPHLRTSRRGRIVNVGSVAGLKGVPLLAHYASSKFAVVGLTQVLALELAGDRILVNAVIPSTTPETGIGRQLLERKIELGWGRDEGDVLNRSIASSFPLGRVGHVDDTVNAILFLLAEESSFVTGHSLVVDGGSALGGPGPSADRALESESMMLGEAP
jgi:meso-butanediol dehydrogenase / (S,S)-butanediol dehydrogenase / diacetyl reductase